MTEFEELVQHCEEKDLHLVIGCDPNPQNTLRASTDCNNRWVALLEFLNSLNLEILNQGSGPTFCNNRRLEVLYITPGSCGLMESITGWEVSSEPSLSGHRHMQFNFEDSLPETLREPAGTPFKRIWRADWSRAHKWTWKTRLDCGWEFLSKRREFRLRGKLLSRSSASRQTFYKMDIYFRGPWKISVGAF